MNLNDSILIARAQAMHGAKMPAKPEPSKIAKALDTVPSEMSIPRFKLDPTTDFPQPREAIALVRDYEKKWCVLHLTLEDGLVVKTDVVERNVAKDIVQDRARREVRGLAR